MAFSLMEEANGCRDILQKAIDLRMDDSQADYVTCLDLFIESRWKLGQAIIISSRECDENVKLQSTLKNWLRETEHQIAVMKDKVQKITPQATKDKQGKVDDSLPCIDTQFADSLLNEVVSSGNNTTFKNIVGNEHAKQQLRENVLLPSLRPDLFTGLRNPVRGILLHGPPGNGKTLLARATANESKRTFFNISASSLLSKWQGESEKKMRTLFDLAREKDLQPVMIFFDEIDSLLCARTEGDSDASRRIKTEFLVQMDGARSCTHMDQSGNRDGFVVIGATNRQKDLDEAVLRRFPLRISVQMPSQDERQILLQHLLADEKHGLSEGDIEDIGKMTAGYSASDLTSLARQAAIRVMRDVDCDLLKKIDVGSLRVMNVQDFVEAAKEVKPSVRKTV